MLPSAEMGVNGSRKSTCWYRELRKSSASAKKDINWKTFKFCVYRRLKNPVLFMTAARTGELHPGLQCNDEN